MLLISLMKKSKFIMNEIYPGDHIRNLNPYSGDQFGTVGGKVYDATTGEEFFLTCYHVVKAQRHRWDQFSPIGKEDIISINKPNIVCGEIVNAVRDNEIDAAVIKPTINFSIGDSDIPVITRKLNNDDVRYSTTLKMKTLNGVSFGNIVGLNQSTNIKYHKWDSNLNEYYPLNNLIKVKSSTNNFSLPGDSGSLVIDEYNYLIGMLVSGDGNVSFIIPIDSIFSKLNIKIS